MAALHWYTREGSYLDEELIYAAWARCPCGAGLAYPAGEATPGGYWDCSDILTGRARDGGAPNIRHTDYLPFTYYECKSENQPSAHGATTRPAAVPVLTGPFMTDYRDDDGDRP